jgi:putative lipoic acid-binding regulatory protein
MAAAFASMVGSAFALAVATRGRPVAGDRQHGAEHDEAQGGAEGSEHGAARYAMLAGMTEGPRTAPARELLLANHVFPGAYTVKAFGPSTVEFRAGIEAAAAGVLAAGRIRVSQRTSRKGARVCITLDLNVDSVDEVIDVYDRIHRVSDLKLVL